METQDGAYEQTKLVMPRRPTMKSSANMHMFKLKLMQTIARKGLGPASTSDKTNISATRCETKCPSCVRRYSMK